MKTIRPLLAVEADLGNVRFPIFTSPKLDGIRCLNVSGGAVSRTLKPIPNKFIREILSVTELSGIDGELIVGATFHQTSSAVMSREGEPVFEYHVFDDFSKPDLPFEQRYLNLGERIMALPAHIQRHINIVDHDRVADLDELGFMENEYLEQGHEGLMIRAIDGHYKFGRSTSREGILLKVKRFQDSEAIVVDTVELCRNENEVITDNLGLTRRSTSKAGKVPAGVLGTLVCATSDGITFEIGSGFTTSERETLWNIRDTLPGRIVNFKHQPHGAKVAPRCPVFRGFRTGG